MVALESVLFSSISCGSVFVSSCEGDEDDVVDHYKIFLYDNQDLVTLESVPFQSRGHENFHDDMNMSAITILHICRGRRGRCPWRIFCHVEKF